MLQLVGLVVSVGLADSLNPSTIGPALYLATGPAPVRRVLAFTAGVFVVFLAAGLVIALGPGELLVRLAPHPSARTKHVVQLAVGVALVVASIVLWTKRRTLAARPLPGRDLSGGSAFLLGAGIALVELPTAVPYFAVIAAIVGSGVGAPGRFQLILLFCVIFCAPLLTIAAIDLVAGERARGTLKRAGDLMQHHWPDLLASILLLVGVGFAGFGVAGLVGG